MKPMEIIVGTKNGAPRRALIDHADAWLIDPYDWRLFQTAGLQYARAQVNGKATYMHHMIIGKHPVLDVDHIDGNGLNNCRENLRFVTRSDNIRGAHIRRAYDKWKASQDDESGTELHNSCKTASEKGASKR